MKNMPLTLLVTSLVEQSLLDQMRQKASFTALDISNGLKADRYPVSHRDVAAAVRDIYASGAMAYFDYERKLIPVVTEGGAKQTQAFLYHFAQVRPRAYQTRDQEALPPVPAEAARDLTDCVPASPLPVLPRPARSFTQARHSRLRRDGALSVPRRLLLQLGWQEGLRLLVTASAGELSLLPADASDAAETVRVWEGSRLRVCRTKLRAGALSAESVTMTVEGDRLKLQKSG